MNPIRHIVVAPDSDVFEALLGAHAPAFRSGKLGTWGTIVALGDEDVHCSSGGHLPVDEHTRLVLAHHRAVLPVGVFHLWWALRESRGVDVPTFDAILALVADTLSGNLEALASLRAFVGPGVECLDATGQVLP